MSYKVNVKFQFSDMPEAEEFDVTYGSTGSGFVYRPDGYMSPMVTWSRMRILKIQSAEKACSRIRHDSSTKC